MKGEWVHFSRLNWNFLKKRLVSTATPWWLGKVWGHMRCQCSLHSLPAWKQLALNVHAFFRAACGTLQSRFTCLCGVAAGSPAVAICQRKRSFVCLCLFSVQEKWKSFQTTVSYLLSLSPYCVLGNKRESSRIPRWTGDSGNEGLCQNNWSRP